MAPGTNEDRQRDRDIDAGELRGRMNAMEARLDRHERDVSAALQRIENNQDQILEQTSMWRGQQKLIMWLLGSGTLGTLIYWILGVAKK